MWFSSLVMLRGARRRSILLLLFLVAVLSISPVAQGGPLADGCGGNWSGVTASCTFSHYPNDVILRVEGTALGSVQVTLYGFNVFGQAEQRLRCTGSGVCARVGGYDGCNLTPSPICGSQNKWLCVVTGMAPGTYRCQVISSPVKD
jgi:hypothetical protein